jgi:hypothetical protein
MMRKLWNWVFYINKEPEKAPDVAPSVPILLFTPPPPVALVTPPPPPPVVPDFTEDIFRTLEIPIEFQKELEEINHRPNVIDGKINTIKKAMLIDMRERILALMRNRGEKYSKEQFAIIDLAFNHFAGDLVLNEKDFES